MDTTKTNEDVVADDRADKPRKIAIVGEIQFSGTAFAKALLKAGHIPRVLCPRKEYEAVLREIVKETSGELEIVDGDLGSPAAVSSVIQGAHAVCFLSPVTMAGRVYRPNTHIEDVEQVIRSAEAHSIRKVAYHSAVGAHPTTISKALRDAAAAEELVAHCRCEDLRIRTGPLMGQGDGFLTELVKPAKTSSLLMKIFGYGSTKVQPLHVDDLARCLTRILINPPDATRHGVYTLAGPDAVTLMELIDSFLELRARFKIKVHIPLFVLKLATLVTKDKALEERTALLFEDFTAPQNDAGVLLGSKEGMTTFRQAQQELLSTANF